MPKKSLKSKLRAKVRKVNSLREQEHAHAGLTINFELQAMQSVAMSHGIMATLHTVRSTLGEDSEQYKAVEKIAHGRMLQCQIQLLQMGLSQAQINERVTRGH